MAPRAAQHPGQELAALEIAIDQVLPRVEKEARRDWLQPELRSRPEHRQAGILPHPAERQLQRQVLGGQHHRSRLPPFVPQGLTWQDHLPGDLQFNFPGAENEEAIFAAVLDEQTALPGRVELPADKARVGRTFPPQERQLMIDPGGCVPPGIAEDGNQAGKERVIIGPLLRRTARRDGRPPCHQHCDPGEGSGGRACESGHQVVLPVD